ncbi:tRNA (adenosine(37)-N6)-dimethylallyltransferase MiaA [Patescibacteria group bacterium]|nr:tRNA (adenosine(37)-N6)-dimethylallyltransferase MiaA [Patescibacteria group bacterium]MBU4458324.1 tRNA (adenosine(37)-N6)-dimethylallyltransferase MiaA [Patescibacteria group bacterium]MCG2695921.1 tRNA (adenosine(37)-N6)-dimethylallyltransferase MiaA [Candidatus Portnoybacteria bacterium]
MRYYIKTFGCQMNESDSERIASFLEQRNYRNTDKMENADLIVVVACSIRQSAIDRIFGLKKKFAKIKAKKILTGCVLKADKPKFKSFFNEILSINEFLGKKYLEMKPKYSCLAGRQACLPARQTNQKSAFVPIMTGCNNFCSYCAVPYTRGREVSRSTKNIIFEIKNLIKNRYKEIILLGQNVNSYKDQPTADHPQGGKTTFPILLKLISGIPGDFTVKFLTSHPKDFSAELIDVITESPKISKEIHLPVQSGDNEILKKMNRGYTTEKYLNLIRKIRAKIPQAKITTDVIVGFPGETKKQFENTVGLFKKVGFDMAYINKYSTRPGTLASRFKDDVLWKEKVRRWRVLNKLTKTKPKLIVIIGPTASGKSTFAIKLAKKINGEIISADSRQVYKGMDIGTGKTTKKEMQDIPHHIIDIANPQKQISVTEYKKLALQAIDKIYKQGKTPIICGGTGFYIQAMVNEIVIPEVKPDWKLRKELEKKTEKELFKQLKKLDPNRAKNIDAKNKRRLIRALEIIIKTNKPIPQLKSSPRFSVQYIKIEKSSAELKKLIDKRVDKMIKMGLEKEVNKLVKKYGWTTVLKNTIGYAEWKNSENRKQIIETIKLHTLQYAKRQLTWFKKFA